MWLYKYKLKSWRIEIFIQHFVSTVPYRKNTVPSAVNIQYTWLRKIDNFLLYIVYICIIYIYCTLHIYCLSISFVFQFIILKGNDSDTLKLKTLDESNARFNTIFNISCSYFEDTISTNFKRYTRHLILPFGCAS